MKIKVLALDLERTLVDNAMSGLPRPGLIDFLEFCNQYFPRVALFTTVDEADAREVIEGLAERGLVPERLAERLEYVGWCGEFKDLRFVAASTPAEVLLVDDDAGWISPDQRDQWISLSAWDGGPDRDLVLVRNVLEGWLAGDRTDAHGTP